MNREELHNLIERYFNAETSVAEECILRRELANSALHGDPLADEARAVMGFAIGSPAAVERRPHKHKSIPSFYQWRNVAAAIVALAATASIMIGAIRHPNGECVAYLNGERISDRQTVMRLMFSDLGDMADASADVETVIAEDLDNIADVIETIE